MSGLGEQIAVLDGLDALDPSDGRLGQRRASVTQYARPIMRGVIARSGMVSAAGGQNYGGGSSYAPRLPLMPSSIGLADADDIIRGGYGRAGLGAAFIHGGYGRAGLGMTNSSADEDLAGAAEAVEVARNMSTSDGRIGQTRAQVDEYGKAIMPGVLARSNVIDPSEGANYSGGSDYYRGAPLMPSSVGLANIPNVLPTRRHVVDYSGGALYSGGSSYAPGLPLMPSSAGLAVLDGLSDAQLGITPKNLGTQAARAVKKAAGKAKVSSLLSRAQYLTKTMARTSQRSKRIQLETALLETIQQLNQARVIRGTVANVTAQKRAAMQRAAAGFRAR
jgi:hypothetical protein